MRILYALLGAAALHASAAALAPAAPASSDAKPQAAANPAAEAKPDAKAHGTTPPAPDATVIADGPVKVDVRDLDAFILRIPENMRAPFRASYDRVAAAADSIYVTRVAANRAREAGLDKDPAVQRRLQQVQEAFLADLYVQKLQKEVDSIDLEQRAKEIYAAEPDKFTSPTQVYVQQIIVGDNGRTHEMARERAEQVAREAKAGKEDFLQLAARYSDDPDKVRNGGDIGFYEPSFFPGAVADAIAKLDTKGQVAGPIETPKGYYIVRFVEREPKQVAPYTAVRHQIIDAERERLRKEKLEHFLAEVRNSKSVVINTNVVDAYVIKVNPATGAPEPAKKREAAAKAEPPAAK